MFANIFNYEIHVKGKKENVLKFFEFTKSEYEKIILYEKELDGEYIMHFTGEGFMTIDHRCKAEYIGPEVTKDNIPDLTFYTLLVKSKLLNLEIQIQSIHFEQLYRSFHHYKKGIELQEEYDNIVPTIEWNKDEYKTLESLLENLGGYYFKYLDKEKIKESDFKEIAPNYFEKKMDEYKFDF